MPSSGRKKKIGIIPKEKERAFSIARLAYNKKADDIVILDMRQLTDYTDYFIICTASSERAAKTIADTILDSASVPGVGRHHTEGYREGEWILIDLGDIVVHIFQATKRAFYDLERLWGDAPRLTLKSYK